MADHTIRRKIALSLCLVAFNLILVSIQICFSMSIFSLCLNKQMEAMPHIAAAYLVKVLEAHSTKNASTRPAQGGHRISYHYLAGLTDEECRYKFR
jgi:hypothetical protein